MHKLKPQGSRCSEPSFQGTQDGGWGAKGDHGATWDTARGEPTLPRQPLRLPLHLHRFAPCEWVSFLSDP